MQTLTLVPFLSSAQFLSAHPLPPHDDGSFTLHPHSLHRFPLLLPRRLHFVPLPAAHLIPACLPLPHFSPFPLPCLCPPLSSSHINVFSTYYCLYLSPFRPSLCLDPCIHLSL